MSTTTCTYCSVNEQVWAARVEFGAHSPQHREALQLLTPELLEAARFGRQHSAGCPDSVATPLVRL